MQTNSKQKTSPELLKGIWERILLAFDTDNPAEIARKMGLDRGAIYKWRDLKNAPTIENLVKISRMTNSSLDWLIVGQGPQRMLEATGESPVYFGDAERRIIQDLAQVFNRSFEEEVRDLVLSSLKDQGHITDQVQGANLIFFGEHVPRLIPMRLWGEIAAGAPLDVFELDETVLVPESFVVRGRENLVLRVKGDSMADEGIMDGDLIICVESPTANNGDTVVALIDGDKATVKKFYKERGQIRLQPRNEQHTPILVTPDRVMIQAIVIGIYRRT